ncbi:hypothetical protein D9M68_903190 [compost metagenome]
MLLPHDLVEVTAGGLVQIVHRGEARGSAGQQLEGAQRLHFLHAAHCLGGMVVHVHLVALVALGVLQGLHLALYRLVLDPSICLA